MEPYVEIWSTGPDALSLEYKLLNGCARGYLDLSDIVNNTLLFGIPRTMGYGSEEELGHFGLRESGPLCNDGSDSVLVGGNSV